MKVGRGDWPSLFEEGSGWGRRGWQGGRRGGEGGEGRELRGEEGGGVDEVRAEGGGVSASTSQSSKSIGSSKAEMLSAATEIASRSRSTART